MKFTLSWLKEHLDTDAGLEDILDALNAIGLEVEGVENPGEKIAPFRIARVLSAERHPQADKLQVLQIDQGDGVPLQVVCGAPNARAGMKGVFGPVGAYVPGSDFTLKLAEIRGVTSNGMMCSTRELELGDDHDGIIELPEDAPVGTVYADYAGLTDPVIEVSVTPNRQDCMGVRGIARDLAAKGAGVLKPLAAVYRQDGLEPVAAGTSSTTDIWNGTDILAAPDVRTDDPQGCPAFYAQAVSGVTNGPAPQWMQAKLKSVGQKPISILVDITNFLSLDLGRPLHVYDRATLTGGLVARRAQAGEELLALNGKSYSLDENMTVIADDRAALGIAGIIGGEDTGVGDTTTDIVIECAYFTPEQIARTGQKLMLTSDARQRFERGVDPAFLDEALSLATRLVLDHCGGTASAITRAGEPPLEAKAVRFDPDLTRTLGGLDVPLEKQRAVLESLGFSVGGDVPWTVTIPSWRRDIDAAPDLVEEVVRMVGIDLVPSTPLPRAAGVAKPTATPGQLTERRMRRAAAARGLNEAVTWSFISEAEAAKVGGGTWTLANPISEDMKVMRPSLLPGLLAAAQRNQDRGAASIRLFEIGRRYFTAPDGTSDEKPTLGFVLAGDKAARSWQGGKASGFGPFDAKAEVQALLAAAGAPVDKLMAMPVDDAGAIWHPGQSGTLRLGPKQILAEYGTLHPALAKAFDLDGTVVAGQIFLDAIPAKRAISPVREAFTPPALQAVTRDFAFLVDSSLPAADLVRAVRGADKQAIVDARLFDDFRGTGVPEGQKSLAIEITLQPGDKSFTDADLKAIADKVVAAAGKLGAVLRG